MKKVLFITNQSDHAVNQITAWLDKLEQPYIRLNTEDFLLYQNKLTLKSETTDDSFKFLIEETEISSSEILSVCYRRPALIFINQIPNAEYIEAQWKHTIWSLATNLDSFWVNHPLWGKYLLEHNKLHQMRHATAVGLKVPETIVSNDITEIIKFSKKHGDKVACKPLRHTNLANENDIPVGIYTQMVTTQDFIGREKSISISPMIVQKYIEKTVELRITIIGHHIFVCEIHSQDSEKTKHDWRRYDFDNVKHCIHILPQEIAHAILELMRHLRLNFGAMDFILDQDGQYIFLEVNPTGQYGWIEDITKQPISETFAQALIHPTKHGIVNYKIL